MPPKYGPKTTAIKNIRKKLLGATIPVSGPVYDKTHGILAEQCLDIRHTNHEAADVKDNQRDVELKVHKHGTSALQTLFCAAPVNNVVKKLLSQFGYWDDTRQRTAFYRTVFNGHDPDFELVNVDKDHFEMVRIDGTPLVDQDGEPYRAIWSKKKFKQKFEQKLERLFSGATTAVTDTEVNYSEFGVYYEGFRPRRFWSMLFDGEIAIDFRCHVQDDGSVRDHGVGIRLDRHLMHRLYSFSRVVEK